MSERREGVKAVKDRSRPTVKERNLSVPQLLLESASVATAWLTTGTVYFQKTVICGYRNLELDPQRKERRNLNGTGARKYKTSTKMMYRDGVQSLECDKKEKCDHAQTNLQTDGIYNYKEGQTE